jgi:hypothetical protein
VAVRVLVLVLSVDREPWRSIERDGQRATWAAPSTLDLDVPVRFYRGRRAGVARLGVGATTRLLRWMGSERPDGRAAIIRESVLRRIGRHYSTTGATTVDGLIRTRVPETYATVATKLFVALRHVLLTEEFDFLLRTNSSTYIDRRRLLDHASRVTASGYWGGFPGEVDDIAFTSGAGTLLSRDVVEAAVEAARDWDWSRIDDVALGAVLTSLGVERQILDRPVVTSADDVAATDLHAFMWRCKGVGERNDVSTMLALHEALGHRH